MRTRRRKMQTRQTWLANSTRPAAGRGTRAGESRPPRYEVWIKTKEGGVLHLAASCREFKSSSPEKAVSLIARDGSLHVFGCLVARGRPTSDKEGNILYTFFFSGVPSPQFTPPQCTFPPPPQLPHGRLVYLGRTRLSH